MERIFGNISGAIRAIAGLLQCITYKSKLSKLIADEIMNLAIDALKTSEKCYS